MGPRNCQGSGTKRAKGGPGFDTPKDIVVAPSWPITIFPANKLGPGPGKNRQWAARTLTLWKLWRGSENLFPREFWQQPDRISKGDPPRTDLCHVAFCAFPFWGETGMVPTLGTIKPPEGGGTGWLKGRGTMAHSARPGRSYYQQTTAGGDHPTRKSTRNGLGKKKKNPPRADPPERLFLRSGEFKHPPSSETTRGER